jgi:hypothetical protein
VRPGDEVVTHCGRCRQERTHQIVALNSVGLPDRVVCRFCQSNHLYRGNRGGGRAGSKKESPAKESAESSRAAASPPRPYSAKEVYAAGEMIQHPKFGQGLVLEARRGKIDVKFGKEIRTFLHAG